MGKKPNVRESTDMEMILQESSSSNMMQIKFHPTGVKRRT